MMGKAEQFGADILEIRLDFLQSKCNLREVIELTELPLIATNRPNWEGGLFKGPEEERINLLLEAASVGFEYIDVELETTNAEEVINRAGKTDVKTIISRHFYHKTPSLSEIHRVFKRQLSRKGDVCKIVTTANSIEDNLTCLRFVVEASKVNPVVCFCMGKLGIPSRLLSPIFGGHFSYASIERGRESAIGQLTLPDAKRCYELMGLS